MEFKNSENKNINLSSSFSHPIKKSITGSSYISFSESYINKVLSNSNSTKHKPQK